MESSRDTNSNLDSQPQMPQVQPRQLGKLAMESLSRSQPEGLPESLSVVVGDHLAGYGREIRNRILDRDDLIACLTTADGQLLPESEWRPALETIVQTEVCHDYIDCHRGSTITQVATAVGLDKPVVRERVAALSCYLIGGCLYLPDHLSQAWKDDYCRRQVEDRLDSCPPEVQARVLEIPNLFEEMLVCRDGLRSDAWVKNSLDKISRQGLISVCLDAFPDGAFVGDLAVAAGIRHSQIYSYLSDMGCSVIIGLVYAPGRSPSEVDVITRLSRHYLADYDLAVQERVIDWARQSGRLFDQSGRPTLKKATAGQALVSQARLITMTDCLVREPGLRVETLATRAGLATPTVYSYIKKHGWRLANQRVYLPEETVGSDDDVVRARVIDLVEIFLVDYDQDVRRRVGANIDLDLVLDPDQALKPLDVISDILLDQARQELARVNLRGQSGPEIMQLDDLAQVLAANLYGCEPLIQSRVATKPELIEAWQALLAIGPPSQPQRLEFDYFIKDLAQQELFLNCLRTNPQLSFSAIIKQVGIPAKVGHSYLKDLDFYLLDDQVVSAADLADSRGHNRFFIDKHLSGLTPEIIEQLAADPGLLDYVVSKSSGPVVKGKHLGIRLRRSAEKLLLEDHIRHCPGQSLAEIGQALGLSESAVTGHIRENRWLSLSGLGVRLPVPDRQSAIIATIDSCLAGYDPVIQNRVWQSERLATILADQPELISRNLIVGLVNQAIFLEHLKQNPGRTVTDIATAIGFSQSAIFKYISQLGCQSWAGCVFSPEHLATIGLNEQIKLVASSLLKGYSPEIQARVVDHPDLSAFWQDDQIDWVNIGRSIDRLGRQESLVDYLEEDPGLTVASLSQKLAVKPNTVRNYIYNIGGTVYAGRVYLESPQKNLATEIGTLLVERCLADYEPEIQDRVWDIDGLIEGLDVGPKNGRGNCQAVDRIKHLVNIERLKAVLEETPIRFIPSLAAELDLKQSTIKNCLADIDDYEMVGYRAQPLKTVLDPAPITAEIELVLDYYIGDYPERLRSRVRSRPDIGHHFYDHSGEFIGFGRQASTTAKRLVQIAEIDDLVEANQIVRLDEIADQLQKPAATVRRYIDQTDYVIMADFVFRDPEKARPSPDQLAVICHHLTETWLADQPASIRARVAESDRFRAYFLNDDGCRDGPDAGVRVSLGNLARLEVVRDYVGRNPGAEAEVVAATAGVPGSVLRKYLGRIDCFYQSGRIYPKTTEIVAPESVLDHYLKDYSETIRSRVRSRPDAVARLRDQQGRPVGFGRRAQNIVDDLARAEDLRDLVSEKPGSPLVDLCDQLEATAATVRRYADNLDYGIFSGLVFALSTKTPPTAEQLDGLCAHLSQELIGDQSAQVRQAVADSANLRQRLLTEAGCLKPDSRVDDRSLRRIFRLEAVRIQVEADPGTEIWTVAAAANILVNSLRASLAEINCQEHLGRLYPKEVGEEFSDRHQAESIKGIVDYYMADQLESVRQAVADMPDLVDHMTDDRGQIRLRGPTTKGIIVSLANRVRVEQYLEEAARAEIGKIATDLDLSPAVVKRSINQANLFSIAGQAFSVKMTDQADKTKIIEVAVEFFLAGRPKSLRRRVARSASIKQIGRDYPHPGLPSNIKDSLIREARILSIEDELRSNPETTPEQLVDQFAISAGVLRSDLKELNRRQPGLLAQTGLLVVAGVKSDRRSLSRLDLLNRHLADFPVAVRQRVSQVLTGTDPDDQSTNKEISLFRLLKLARLEWVREIVENEAGLPLALVADRLGLSQVCLSRYSEELGFFKYYGAIFSPDQIKQLDPRQLALAFVSNNLAGLSLGQISLIARDQRIIDFFVSLAKTNQNSDTKTMIQLTANKILLESYVTKAPGVRVAVVGNRLNVSPPTVRRYATSLGFDIIDGRLWPKAGPAKSSVGDGGD